MLGFGVVIGAELWAQPPPCRSADTARLSGGIRLLCVLQSLDPSHTDTCCCFCFWAAMDTVQHVFKGTFIHSTHACAMEVLENYILGTNSTGKVSFSEWFQISLYYLLCHDMVNLKDRDEYFILLYKNVVVITIYMLYLFLYLHAL